MKNKKYGNYKCGELLGKGGYGNVYLAEKDNQKYAIKALDKDKIIEENLGESIKKEIQLMRMISHPYIVKLYEVIATQQKIMLVMEYIDAGDMFDAIKSENGSKMSEEKSRMYFQQMIQALEYCHKLNIIHRDLKPENILIDKKNNCIKISDFGLSTILKSKDELIKNACGTTNYLAPEVIKLTGYQGQPSDIWSAGVILYNCVTGSFPFYDEDSATLLQNILTGNLSYPKNLSKNLVDLFRKIFEVNPKNRITIGEIKAHPWFKIDFKPVKGVLDQSKTDNNIQYVEEENIKETFAIQEIHKEFDYLNIKKINCFELASMLSGRWVTQMFEEEKNNVFNTSNRSVFFIFCYVSPRELLEEFHQKLWAQCSYLRYCMMSDSNFQCEADGKGKENTKFNAFVFTTTKNNKSILSMKYLSGSKLFFNRLVLSFIDKSDKDKYRLLDK